jgi:hypothetical protein
MSKGKRKPAPKQARPSGYRAPAPAADQPRKGIFDSILAPRTSGASPMPTLRRSIARGFVTVISTPAIVGYVAVVTFAQWVVLVAFGFQGPFSDLSGVFAWPGPGTLQDGQLAALVFGNSRGTLFTVFGFIAVRGLVLAVLTTMAVERLRTGAVSAWSLRRCLHVLPAAITANMVGLGILLVANIAGGFLGQLGLGFFVFVAGLVATVWLTASSMAVAADEDRSLGGAMQRSLRVARAPGSGSLTLAALYAIPAFAVASTIGLGGQTGVNPSIGRWAVILGVNLLHASVAAMFAFRYLAGGPFVPEAPAPAARARR